MAETTAPPGSDGGVSSRLLSAAALIMAGNVLSRLLALGRVMLSSYYFGVSPEMESFTIADNVRTMLFDLLISGMITAAFVPVFSDYLAPERRATLRRIMLGLLLIALVGVGLVVVALMLAADTVVWVMTSLLAPVGTAPLPGERTGLTVALVRAMLPAVLLLSLSAVLLAGLQALGRFANYALALLLPNGMLILTVVVAHGLLGQGIVAMVWGTVAGGLGLVVAGAIGLRDVLRPARPALNHPAIRLIGRLYLPIFGGLFVSTLALIYDRNLAASLGHEVIPAMLYATQIQQMALGLVAAAIGLATLPALAQAPDLVAFRATLGSGLRLILLLIVPATLGLAALAEPVVRLLYQHGATGERDADLIVVALLGYLVGLPFAAADQLLIFGFYARKNTRAPVLVGVAAVVVFAVAALPLSFQLGMLGLVLANSLQFAVHALVMAALAVRAYGGLGPGVGRAGVVALAAGLPMAAVAGGLAWLLAPVPGLLGEVARVALPVVAGGACYLWLVARLGVPDLARIGTLVRRRLGR